MFERLIESETDRAGKSRRTYFVTSSVIVGILFITAVVLSIYADDYGLGELDLELTELSSPIDTTPVEPEPERPRPAPSKATTSSETTMRTQNVVASTETSTKIPDGISTAPNTAPVAPKGSFAIGLVNTDAPSAGSGRESGGDVSDGPAASDPKPVEPNPIPVPPPVVPKPKPPVSKGVINGEAKHLPIPPYPQIAKLAGVRGLVKVQVTLDETGKVIAANAVEGHVMLQRGAVQAARGARFSPTLLNNAPVKVTGIIIYNFK